MNSFITWKNTIEQNHLQERTLWAILGGSCSGKSRILKDVSKEEERSGSIIDYIPKEGWNGLDGDRYYFSRQRNMDRGISVDHPDSWNWERLVQDLTSIKKDGKVITIPRYEIINDMGVSSEHGDTYSPGQHNCIAGIHSYDERIASLLTGYVYLHVPLHLLYLRRIARDGFGKTGQTPKQVQEQFIQEVLPAMEANMFPKLQELAKEKDTYTTVHHFREAEEEELLRTLRDSSDDELFLNDIEQHIVFLKEREKNYLF